MIRRACKADAAGLLAMVEQLARHHGDVPRASLAALERDLFGPQPWATALVAEGPATLQGYAMLCPLYRGHFGERGVDLHHLFVLEPVRNTGLGRLLVEAALGQARQWDCRYLAVGTHPDNAAAQRFYERLGFERAGQSGPRFRVALDVVAPTQDRDAFLLE